ncbi:MAG: Ig-like domain-containing protein [Gemmatimonadaceae bacterium]
MRRLLVIGVLAIGACAKEVTAPRVLRVVPIPEVGVFSASAQTLPTAYGDWGTVGHAVATKAMVVDQDDNPVPGVRVAWAVEGGAGSLDAPATVTDSTGIASVNWTLDTIARLDSLRASIASGASLVLVASGTHGAEGSATKVSGDGQKVAPGATSTPLVIRVADQYGNPIGGVFVAWAAIHGGTLSSATTTTDASGMAQVTLATGSAPATYTVVATLGALPAVTFTVTAAR